jgi:hypothetical protein
VNDEEALLDMATRWRASAERRLADLESSRAYWEGMLSWQGVDEVDGLVMSMAPVRLAAIAEEESFIRRRLASLAERLGI